MLFIFYTCEIFTLIYILLFSPFKKLCSRGASTLQTKSQTVEEAANELINMLCDVEATCQEDEAKEEEEEDQGFDEDEGEGDFHIILMHHNFIFV